MAIDLPSLNAVVSHALGSGRSNVRNLRLTIEDGTLRQKGTIDKAIDIPFNSRGTVGLTPDGRIRVHSESVKGFGVPVKPLMKIFGVQMDDLLHVAPDTGVTTEGNDLLLDPSRLMPPPVIRGRVTAVRIEGQSLVQVMGTGPDRPLDPPASSPNHILWRGGQITFGKLTMSESDLEVIDEDPGDPLDFSAEGWNRQLVAGYSKITSRRGLQAHVPDYNDLNRRHLPPPGNSRCGRRSFSGANGPTMRASWEGTCLGWGFLWVARAPRASGVGGRNRRRRGPAMSPSNPARIPVCSRTSRGRHTGRARLLEHQSDR